MHESTIVPIFVKQFVNDDVCPVTGEDGPAVTHNGRTAPSKHKWREDKSFPPFMLICLSTCTTQYSCWQPVSTKLL